MILNRTKKPFFETELNPIEVKPATPRSPEIPIFDTPISYRENTNAMFWNKEAAFVPTRSDFTAANSSCYGDHLGRTKRVDGKGVNMVDVFGVQWTYVEAVGGSITLGGNPIFEDANDWKEKITIPDIEQWDWAADAAKNKIADPRYAVEMTFVNGFGFERLISQMDFMNAAIALADEEQEDALHEYLSAMTELGCKLVDKACEYWPSIDGFMIHDDWGSQKAPFFSQSVAENMFYPHLKELVDHVHAKGRYFGIHSCGHIEDRVGVFAKAGIDTWQMQTMNNVHKLYELYGDQIVFQAWPEAFDVNDEKAAVQAAHDYVDTFCKPGKPTMLGSTTATQSRVFFEELYRYSRKHYSK